MLNVYVVIPRAPVKIIMQKYSEKSGIYVQMTFFKKQAVNKCMNRETKTPKKRVQKKANSNTEDPIQPYQ